MKQNITVLLLMFLPAMVFAQSTEKNPDSLWNVQGQILITNKGFAPIPAFSFEKPAVMAFLSVEKGLISYQPEVALGLNGDLWMNNHWFRYSLVRKESFVLGGGVNLSLFFLHTTETSGHEIIRANRNITLEGSGDIFLGGNSTIRVTYRYNYAADPGTVSGHVVDLSALFSDIYFTDQLFFSLRPQMFYFNHTGNMDGLFTSIYTDTVHMQIPVSFFMQGVYRIWSNFHPSPVFQLNAGFQYAF